MDGKNREDPLILAVNPGSTSTKTGLFRGEEAVAKESISHSVEELAPFKHLIEQFEMRREKVLSFLEGTGFAPKDLDAVVGRGGLLKPIVGGTYRVNEKMLSELRAGEHGEHASNLGAVIAHSIAEPAGIPSFIVDPVVVDELVPEARLSGLEDIPRRSIFHALNHKAMARKAAGRLGKPYGEARLVVAHMGGGISVGAHMEGRVVDVNNALNGDGPFAPERTGGLPAWDLVQLTLSFTYNKRELQKLLTGNGGMVSYLGTNDIREAWKRAGGGEEKAALVIRAMAWQAAREIGACASVLEGKVDAVVLTGGLAKDEGVVDLIRSRVEWIAPVLVLPGEAELEALAMGGLRVLRGEEEAKEYV